MHDANNIIVMTNNKNYQGTSSNPTSVPEDSSYTKGYRDGYVQGQRLLQERYFELALECNKYAFESQKFFTKELWRKVSGFENCYKSFVENAFSWYWMKQDMISKGEIFSKEVKDIVNRNIDHYYDVLFDEYETWKENENKKQKSFWNKVKNFIHNIFQKINLDIS